MAVVFGLEGANMSVTRKPEAVLDWIKTHGVEAAAWVYGKTDQGFPSFRGGPIGMSMTPVGGDVKKALFVPISTWRFIKKRVAVSPPGKPSMFAVT